MEAAAEAPGGAAALSCFSYNQDCTSLAIGTTTGYRLFSLSSVEQLDQVHESNEIPDVYIVERLFSSSLVVVVSHAKPQQMNVYHFKKGTEICNYSYSSNILSIRLNRQHAARAKKAPFHLPPSLGFHIQTSGPPLPSWLQMRPSELVTKPRSNLNSMDEVKAASQVILAALFDF